MLPTKSELLIMILKKLIIRASALDYNLRKFILIILDFFCINCSILLAIYFSKEIISINNIIAFSTICTLLGLITYFFTGQYKGLSKYLGSSELYKIILRISILIIFSVLFLKFFLIKIPPFNFLILFWIILSFFTGGVRFISRDLLLLVNKKFNKKSNVYIYGAGSAAVQLATSIIYDGNSRILGFIDDNPELWGRTLKGLKISSPKILEKNKEKIDKILFAISAISRFKKKVILNKLQKLGVEILQTPSVKELTNSKVKINELKPVIIDDLLGRDVIIPKDDLLRADIFNKSICVTGAGGSIGSELCLQIINLKPKKLILFEMSEVALFNIQKELSNCLTKDSPIVIKSILGTALDEKLILDTFKKNNIEIVFHAAAYKHVPLVEDNPLSGLMNNIFSTYTICKSAKKNSLKKVILISSDKAVRPTNIMGISKRISELIVQAFADESIENKNKNKIYTNFSMVRFGNVLNSSGSVVPLFIKQIKQGGPITLTHPNVMRYFMTIPEAAQLVIQAATLAKGGEVFLLDMGDPVNIKDLAIKMINLSGMTVKDKKRQDGDIEIKITGLRPGEKMYEELLIDGKSSPTAHPLIFKANEKFIEAKELWPKLDHLKEVIIKQNTKLAIELAASLIPESKIKL